RYAKLITDWPHIGVPMIARAGDFIVPELMEGKEHILLRVVGEALKTYQGKALEDDRARLKGLIEGFTSAWQDTPRIHIEGDEGWLWDSSGGEPLRNQLTGIPSEAVA